MSSAMITITLGRRGSAALARISIPVQLTRNARSTPTTGESRVRWIDSSGMGGSLIPSGERAWADEQPPPIARCIRSMRSSSSIIKFDHQVRSSSSIIKFGRSRRAFKAIEADRRRAIIVFAMFRHVKSLAAATAGDHSRGQLRHAVACARAGPFGSAGQIASGPPSRIDRPRP